jgi:hypothetical protein
LSCAGTGKTTVAKRVGMLLESLGLLAEAQVVACSASDFVTGYVNQAAGKTREIFDSALGKVLFIDEAYRWVPFNCLGISMQLAQCWHGAGCVAWGKCTWARCNLQQHGVLDLCQQCPATACLPAIVLLSQSSGCVAASVHHVFYPWLEPCVWYHSNGVRAGQFVLDSKCSLDNGTCTCAVPRTHHAVHAVCRLNPKTGGVFMSEVRSSLLQTSEFQQSCACWHLPELIIGGDVISRLMRLSGTQCNRQQVKCALNLWVPVALSGAETSVQLM